MSWRGVQGSGRLGRAWASVVGSLERLCVWLLEERLPSLGRARPEQTDPHKRVSPSQEVA